MYDDEDDVKIYLIYLKKRLYAWSSNKKDKNLFLQQRNDSLFTIKKVVMTSLDYRCFRSQNKDKELVEIPIESNGEIYLLMATYKEDQKFESIVGDLENKYEKIKKQIKRLDGGFKIPEKYMDAFKMLSDYQELVDSIASPGKKDNIFNVNSLSLFMDTFKNTF